MIVTLRFSFHSNSTNSSVCKELWDECDDSVFNEICDLDLIEKVTDDHEPTQTDKDADSVKRKYCETESNEGKCQEIVAKQKKMMMRKFKSNSLFKF